MLLRLSSPTRLDGEDDDGSGHNPDEMLGDDCEDDADGNEFRVRDPLPEPTAKGYKMEELHGASI